MLSTGQRQLESVKAKYQTKFASMKTVLYIYCKDEAELIEVSLSLRFYHLFPSTV